MNIEWRSGIGYGDFVTGLGYSRNWAIKTKREINITFHWNHEKSFLFSKKDPETIIDRFNYINSILIPNNNVYIDHKFNSNPKFRFINQLDEFNPLHGLNSSIFDNITKSNKVVIWTTNNNISFPGTIKDPVNEKWKDIISLLKEDGYEVVEVDYRTPIVDVIEHIRTCSFGIGYDGLVHQLFKFMWKPLIVFCKRFDLVELLIPWAYKLKDANEFLFSDYTKYIKISEKLMHDYKNRYKNYLNEYVEIEKHGLYNTPIY